MIHCGFCLPVDQETKKPGFWMLMPTEIKNSLQVLYILSGKICCDTLKHQMVKLSFGQEVARINTHPICWVYAPDYLNDTWAADKQRLWAYDLQPERRTIFNNRS